MPPRLQASPLALLAAALLLVCLGLLWILGPVPYSAQTLIWQHEQGETLQARLWLPREAGAAAQTPLQGVLLVHGVASNAQQLAPAARALAAGGQAVLTLSLRGPEDQQVQQLLSAVQLLRSQPRIQAVVLVGHSRGARLAAEVALLAGDIAPVIALGARPDNLPLNAVMTGLYDSLHPPWRLPAGPQTFVSPSASHQSVWHDLWLQRQLQQLLSDQPAPLVRESLRLAVQVLLALSLLALGASQYPLRPGGYPGVLLLTGASGVLLMAGYLGGLQPAAAALALLLLGAVYLLGQVPRTFWHAGWPRLLLLLIGLREAGTLLRALIWDPTALLWWPVALWQNLLVYPLWLQRGLEQFLFVADAAQLQPAWPLLALLAAELLFPAWWRRWLVSDPTGSAPAQAFIPLLPVPLHGRLKGLLPGLLGLVLLGLLFWRLDQGYLSAESLGRLAETLALEMVPAALLAALLWWGRGRWGHKECPRDDSNVRPTV